MKVNLTKALDSLLKAAARGSTLAMVDAGLISELGDPVGHLDNVI